MKLNYHGHRPQGMALILTVFMISLLTILMVGFLSSMMTEKRAAHAYEDAQRAKLMSQGAISHAIDILRTNIPEPARLSESPLSAPAENWLVNPGRLTLIKPGQKPVFIPLHTGEVTSMPSADEPRDAESVDLNRPLPGSFYPMIAPAEDGGDRPEMRVKWVNVYRDPSSDPSAENPLMGRYAFWIDDENAKINYNLAIGKRETAANERFARMLRSGHVTPLFKGGTNITSSGTGAGDRVWGLGRPQSVNLDVLLEKPSDFRHDDLAAHMFLQGFSRYPEGVLKFLDVTDPTEWFERNKFNLTFYNRGPEFNVFGLPRWFPSYVPLSLEIGPSYQHPFVHKSGGQAIYHSPMLFGYFGFGSFIQDETGRQVDPDNQMVLRQFHVIMQYLNRVWPGYNQSFVDKYGWDECAQMALNMLMQNRFATSDMASGNTLLKFSEDWATRSTSINYNPDVSEIPGNQAPERFYWKIKRPDGSVKTLLPNMMGPQLAEIRLIVQAVDVAQAPTAGGENLSNFVLPKHVQYKFEYEFYSPPSSPVIDLSVLIPKTDYMRITSEGKEQGLRTQTFDVPSWGNASHLGVLQTLIPEGVTIGPKGSRQVPLGPRQHRVVVTSPTFLVGFLPGQVPRTENWSPRLFDATKNNGGKIKVKFNFRAGVGIKGSPNRPYVMAPLGETNQDALEAEFTVNLNSTAAQAISWQLNDPRLGIHKEEWEKGKTGPGPLATIGTIGAPNKITTGAYTFTEPAEESSEKSKYKLLMRGHENSKLHVDGTNYNLNRGDEYTTNSRVSSPGYWTLIAAGIQSRTPWKTLSLSKPNTEGELPDYLLLDLFGGMFPMAHDQWKIEQRFPDEFSTSSFMNSTAGQVNINTKIYPDTDYFKVPARRKPLTAVFKHLYDDSKIEAFVDNITSYQTQDQYFSYTGELANVAGVDGGATTEWDKERILRNMAGILTTKSNTFGVWGVAQVVSKARSNRQFDKFEKGDSVAGEKRFYALVERYVWTGKDGVPGNGHVGPEGTWDRKQTQASRLDMSGGIFDTVYELPGSPPLRKAGAGYRLLIDSSGSFPVLDGPEEVFGDTILNTSLAKVEYQKSSLEEAYNPPQAAIKYRVVYFKFLDH